MISKEYAKADAVRRMLLKFYHAARQTGWSACLLGGEVFRSRPEGLRPDMFERMVVLSVDGERFLMSLEPLQRRVVAGIVLQGQNEWLLARRERTSQAHISRIYWQGIRALYELFVRSGYVAPVEEWQEELHKAHCPPPTQAGAESSVACMAAGLAGSNPCD